jgi:hypothetical protein
MALIKSPAMPMIKPQLIDGTDRRPVSTAVLPGPSSYLEHHYIAIRPGHPYT